MHHSTAAQERGVDSDVAHLHVQLFIGAARRLLPIHCISCDPNALTSAKDAQAPPSLPSAAFHYGTTCTTALPQALTTLAQMLPARKHHDRTTLPAFYAHLRALPYVRPPLHTPSVLAFPTWPTLPMPPTWSQNMSVRPVAG